MNTNTQDVVIWDLFVRVFHWSVATLFLLDFWVLEAGDPPHEWVGYALGFFVFARVLWGFVGSHAARFGTFFPTPTRIRHHLTELRQRRVNPAEGHNPLGGAMILFLLFMLSVLAMSGWMLTWDRFWGEEWLEELHEWVANVVMGAVVIHVSAIVIMGAITGISLIRTMITGKRSIPTAADQPPSK